jgi:hypothetical protein
MERTVGMMPRRNRNAHAFTISADKLAAQADQLTAEIGTANSATLQFLDEIQLYDSFFGIQRAEETAVIRDHVIKLLQSNPGRRFSLNDGKVVTNNGRY